MSLKVLVKAMESVVDAPPATDNPYTHSRAVAAALIILLENEL